MTTQRTLPDVLNQYVKVLQKRKELETAYKAEDEKLSNIKHKMENWLLGQEDTIEPPDNGLTEPYIFWKVAPKTIESAIKAYRQIRDMVSESNSLAAEFEKTRNAEKDTIGKWIFAETERTKVKSGKTDYGSYHRKLKTQASIADLDNLVAWAAENKAGDIMYKRVNSNFIVNYYNTKLEEDKEKAEAEGREPVGEYPPYVNVSREYEIVVTK